MKSVLKKMGIVSGGTVAACAVCCAAPSLLAPLLAWLGLNAAGLVYSPWLALLMALLSMLFAVQLARRRAHSRQTAPSPCDCENTCLTQPNGKSACR